MSRLALMWSHALVGLAWGLTMPPAFGAVGEAVFGAEFAVVPPWAWFWVLMISALTAMTTLLIKIDMHYRKTKTDLERKGSFAAQHMAGSTLAGVLGFLGALHLNLPDFGVGLVVIGCSFVGAPTLEAALRRYANMKIPGIADDTETTK